jgi:hypothetical protein
MPQADSTILECLIQGLKYHYSGILTHHNGIILLKDTVIGLVPNIDAVLTSGQQTALLTSITDQNNICSSSVYSVIAGKTEHPSHNWRRILGI